MGDTAHSSEEAAPDAERHRTLLAINNAIISNLTQEALFRAIAGALRRVVPFDRTAIFLHDPLKDVLRLFVLESALTSKYFVVGLENVYLQEEIGREHAKRGVEIRLNIRLYGATAEAALLDGGEQIPTRTLVSTVPSGPNPVVAALPLARERGRIVVGPDLEVPGHPGVWAVGDCAWIIDAKSNEPCPPTAQHAIREARCAAGNIVATLGGTPRRAFAFKALGKMGALGHHSAVAEIFGVKLSGFLAWWLWRTIYLMKLPGLDRKIRVAADWTLDLFLPPDIVQLKTDRAFTIQREHYEPGQTVFREGDRGDWLYVVVDGEVEIIQKFPDQREVVLRRLGPGECFGEIALVSERPRTATARCLTRANVLAVDRDAFNALFATLPPLRGFFQQLIAERVGAGEPEGAGATR
ncbi:MAG: cyclic nucleotide-binding domain-containing protein [Candidatus Rokuibacteriota bacterium]